MTVDEEEKKFIAILDKLGFPCKGSWVYFWNPDDIGLDGDFTRQELRILIQAMDQMEQLAVAAGRADGS